MKIALLGAGHIGQTIARLLAASGDYQVTVMDQNAAALARVAGQADHPVHPALTTHRVDSEDAPALLAALRAGGGHDAIVNALPYHLAVATATLARLQESGEPAQLHVVHGHYADAGTVR